MTKCFRYNIHVHVHAHQRILHCTCTGICIHVCTCTCIFTYVYISLPKTVGASFLRVVMSSAMSTPSGSGACQWETDWGEGKACHDGFQTAGGRSGQDLEPL